MTQRVSKNISKYIGIKLSPEEVRYIVDSQNLDYNLEELDFSMESDMLKMMNAISVFFTKKEWKYRSFLAPEIYLKQASEIRKAAKDQNFELTW